jgi:PAS domain S-box-containing protein
MGLMPRGLYGKLILLVSLILIVGILINGAVNFKTQSRHSEGIIKQNAVVMARNLSLSCADYLIVNDYGSMELFLTRFGEFPDILGIQVYDGNGNILSDIVHDRQSAPKLRFGSGPLKVPDSAQTSVQVKGNEMTVLQPIIAGNLLGWVKITYSMDMITAMKGIIWKNSLLLGIIGVAISFIALLIVLRPPVRSIERIADFARRLNDIKGRTIPVEHGFIELEHLSSAFNYASQKLHSTEKDIISEKERYQILHQIAVELNRIMDFDEILSMILCFSRDTLKAEIATIALYDDTGKIKKLIKRGVDAMQDNRLLEGKDIFKFMQYSLTPVRISDTTTHPAFCDELHEGRPWIRNFLGFPLFSSKGKPIGSLCFANKLTSDFTDADETILKAIAADAAIAVERGLSIEELERFKKIIDGAFDVITITDKEGSIVYVNQAFETLTGYKRDEVTGKKPNILRSGLHDAEFYKRLWENLTHGSPWKGEIINRRKDGELLMVSTIIFPVSSSDGSIAYFVAIQRDVTEEKRLYEQLLRAQKMEAIGTLAGGIAHDFNNILSSVLGYAEFLKSSLSPDDELFRYADIIEKSAYMGAELSKKIMSITRKEHTELKPVNLNSVVTETVALLKMSIPKGIDLDVRLEEGLPNIKADHSQISQVILNLVINAKDAMPQGGRLHIATTLEERENIAAGDLNPETGVNFIRLSVEDTGTGISKKYQSKIFDPFFTTKDPGKGTGLGLYIVHSIVMNHGGYINLYSEPNKGTRFNVYFPAYLASVEDVMEGEDISEGMGETVLVIDDEEFICDLYCDALTKAGYKVLRTTDPKEGIDIFKENPQVDAVILDVVMPHMDGKEVFQVLTQLKPDVKVILSSGYSKDLFADINKMMSSGAKAFMQKPVSIKTLLTTTSKIIRQ